MIMAILTIKQLPSLCVFTSWLVGLQDFSHSKTQLEELNLHVLRFKPDKHLSSIPSESLTKLGLFNLQVCKICLHTSPQPVINTVALYGVSHQHILDGDSVVNALRELRASVKEVVAKETRMCLPRLKTVEIQLSCSKFQSSFSDDGHLRELERSTRGMEGGHRGPYTRRAHYPIFCRRHP